MRNCHVHRLAIQAPDAAAAARGALLVEDALRTASLPGENSRLLIVRRLHIGVIPAGANAAAVSRGVEAALAQLPVQAVAAADPAAANAAANAAAVYFADEVEACVQLAVLGARGQAPDAWFWPRAVAGWRNGYDAAYAVRCALGSAARQSSEPGAAAHAVVRVVSGLLAAGALDAALAALEPGDGPVLLRLCGWRQASPRAGAAATPARQNPLSPGSSAQPPGILTPQNLPRLAAWAEAWGAGDARTLWLAAALLAVEQAARASDPALPEQAAIEVEQVTAPSLSRTAVSKAAAGQALARAALRGEVGARMDTVSAGLSLPGGASPSHGVQAPSPAGPPRGTETSPPAASLLWWRGLPLRPTAAGGLWFLLPVLARLGIKGWLHEHPEWGGVDFPWRVLADLAHMAGTPPDDPVWTVLRHEIGPGRADDAGRAVVWWHERVQAWCSALPTLGEAAGETPLRLDTIVRRRGWLYITATHIDVFFDLAQADLRIRRLGLDVDPGWLPWLRRVVTFYYEEGLAGHEGR